MNVSYDIQARLVRLVLAGTYSMQDIERTLDAALNDPECPKEALLLMDVTGSDSLKERSTDDLRYMAKYLASLASRFGTRMGIVAGSRLHYGIMRMAEVFSETSGFNARVFLEDTEAVEWLLNDEPD